MGVLDILEQVLNKAFAAIPREKPLNVMANEIKLIAHRGAHDNKSGCFENTDAAFSRAYELGCWGIELDVHATADDILVVNHDPTLSRLWGLDKAISELSFSALRKRAPMIPALEEVILKYGNKLHLFIELKAPFKAQKALSSVLQSLIPHEHFHLISLDENLLDTLTDFPTKSLLLVAGYKNHQQFCELSLKKHYGGVLGHYLLLNQKILSQLQLAQQSVGVGFVNSKNSLYREANRNIPWLFSNNVEKVHAYLKGL